MVVVGGVTPRDKDATIELVFVVEVESRGRAPRLRKRGQRAVDVCGGRRDARSSMACASPLDLAGQRDYETLVDVPLGV